MRIYLSGPMRGIEDNNVPAFHAVAAKLRDAGHSVFNPAAQGNKSTLREYMAADLSWICTHADAVALLDGWEQSKGAQAEVATALALNLLALGWREFI